MTPFEWHPNFSNSSVTAEILSLKRDTYIEKLPIDLTHICVFKASRHSKEVLPLYSMVWLEYLLKIIQRIQTTDAMQ